MISDSERFHRNFTPESNILVCGIPNVGKSSLINLIRNGTLRLSGKPLKVGARPGVTRAVHQKIRVSDDPKIFLLDTPGIMMPNIRNIETGMKLALCGMYFNLIIYFKVRLINFYPSTFLQGDISKMGQTLKSKS